TTARDIGIDQRVGLLPRLLFAACMLLFRLVDSVARLVWPEFSVSRLLTRIVGYQFTVKVLMNQTRPLKLPPVLLGQVADMTAGWRVDPKAPDWMNDIEQRLTRKASPAPAQNQEGSKT
ncbi:MAG: DUF2236 domain-containing protein, partial [Massilia sp.]